MSKHIEVKFTQKEIKDIFECLESMLGMVGAGDQDFNREAKDGFNSMNKALKRSGFVYIRPDYSNQNINP